MTSSFRAVLLVGVVLCGSYMLMGAPRPSEPGSLVVPTDREYLAATSGYRSMTFLELSGFDYREGMPLSALPAEVRQAHGQKVALHGFMMPLDASSSGVSRFLLNGNYDMCMFGAATGSPNQWVDVVMPRGRPATYTHLPLTVIGALTVGEQRSRSRVYALYRIDADRVLTSVP
jgi:hypothetical protein